MDEHINHINNRFSEQLPSHSPDPGTWQSLSTKLDAMDAVAAYQQKLQSLPKHSPDEGTWGIISSRLNRIGYYKTAIRISVSIAAGMLLFFTVSQVSDKYQTGTTKSVPQLTKQEQPVNPSAVAVTPKPDKNQIKSTQESSNHTRYSNSGNYFVAHNLKKQKPVIPGAEANVLASGNNTVTNTALNQESLSDKAEIAVTPSDNVNFPNSKVSAQSDNNSDQVAQNSSKQNGVPQIKDTTYPATEYKSILFQKEEYPTTALISLKQYSPPEPKLTANKNHVALDMNYLPENIYNGTDNSLFHNVDFTASYNKQKVRFNTSVGMAYNEEQLSFDMSYDINTPVTAMGPGGKVDTLSYNVENMDSEYLGTEKHKYVTYNLGFGRRIFSAGKFSTWFNAGAGFGVQLNNPDLITSTANSIKNLYNAQTVRVKSSKPIYNDVNINFVTAIDFNYRILNKLSITFTPTSRWYFKPVLSLNNQATDELTLGFRTGLKFSF